MLRRFLNLFERNTSDDSLDFTVLFILPFSESLKWNKSSFTFICWISPAWNRVSQLIYPAVWLTFYRGLPLAGSELHGNLYVGFFMFYKPGRFLSTLYLWRILFTLEWKKNSHLVFPIQKKKLKRTGVPLILAATALPIFQAFFAYTSSSESKKPFVIYSLSIYYSSSTGERADVYHWGWKGSGS